MAAQFRIRHTIYVRRTTIQALQHVAQRHGGYGRPLVTCPTSVVWGPLRGTEEEPTGQDDAVQFMLDHGCPLLFTLLGRLHSTIRSVSVEPVGFNVDFLIIPLRRVDLLAGRRILEQGNTDRNCKPLYLKLRLCI